MINTTQNYIYDQFKQLIHFLKGIRFARAIRVTVAVSLPILTGLKLGYFEIGLALGLGAFWSSPSDVSGSVRHKENGILLSTLLATIVSFIGGYLHYDNWFSLPVLGLLSFGIAFLSVFGFRASLISLSGLLALVVSLAYEPKELDIYQYALLIAVGGLWYWLLTTLWHRLYSTAETEAFLTDTYDLTADIFTTRSRLIDPKENRRQLQSQLLNQQSKLTENHETLREILVLTRKNSGWSNYQNKRLLIFVQLIDMLETAIANPVDYEQMNMLFKAHPHFIQKFQSLIYAMAAHLRKIASAGLDDNKLPDNNDIEQYLKYLQNNIDLLRDNLHYNEYLMLQNFLGYQEKQFAKLKRIKWLLGEPSSIETGVADRQVAKRFISNQEYHPRLLVRNFSFKSTIFRHSARLAVTVMLAYVLGSLFHFQNPHWVLLAVIVIMRPGFGLTKNRAKDRLVGTLIGGIIATGMVILITSPFILGTMAMISLLISLSLLQKNNQASAIFITLTVAFIYAILQPGITTLIKYRMLDTFAGALLSYVAILWLWPTWEFEEIKKTIQKSVQANRLFLKKISDYYQQKGTIPTAYNVARKQAFLETANLSAAYQRMTQEPKSKQKDTEKVYELVVLNHRFLTSLASLSTYIRNHETAEASEQFAQAIKKIDQHLKKLLETLENGKDNYQDPLKGDTFFNERIPNFDSDKIDHLESKDPESVRQWQEIQLLWQQLQWLYSISHKMCKLAVTIE